MKHLFGLAASAVLFLASPAVAQTPRQDIWSQLFNSESFARWEDDWIIALAMGAVIELASRLLEGRRVGR